MPGLPGCGHNRLDVPNWAGMCYGSCGKLTVAELFDSDFTCRDQRAKKNPSPFSHPAEARNNLLPNKTAAQMSTASDHLWRGRRSGEDAARSELTTRK